MKIFRGWLNSMSGFLMVAWLVVFAVLEWLRLLGQAGMATVYSDAFVKVRAGRRVAPNVFGGKIRVIDWDFASLPAGNVADILVCGKIYKGDRVIGGRELHSALTSGGGTATGSYGTYAILADGVSLGALHDVDRFLVATSFESAGTNLLADSDAHYNNWEADDDYFLCCLNSVEAFATAGHVFGHLLVVRD